MTKLGQKIVSIKLIINWAALVHTICNSQVSYGFITPGEFYTFQTEKELKFLPTSLNARPFWAVKKMKLPVSVEVWISSYNSWKIQQM